MTGGTHLNDRDRLLADFDAAVAATNDLLSSLPPAAAGYAPPGEDWTVSQVLHHFITGLSHNLMLQDAGRHRGGQVPAEPIAEFNAANEAARGLAIADLAAIWEDESRRFRENLASLTDEEVAARYVLTYPSGRGYADEGTIKTIEIGIHHVMDHVQQVRTLMTK